MYLFDKLQNGVFGISIEAYIFILARKLV